MSFHFQLQKYECKNSVLVFLKQSIHVKCNNLDKGSVHVIHTIELEEA